jgi:SAM-dependent methyltransferase
MSFDDLALAYDNSIDWEARLNREMPYLLSLLPKKGRVLDVACGSGRHSLELAGNGHTVVGLDSSDAMVGYAEQLARERSLDAKFIVSDMRNVRESVEPEFNLIICLGNSFALLPSYESLQRVLSNLAELLKVDGHLLFQVLNFEEILSTQFRFFPLKGGVTFNGNQVIFGRFYEHHANYSTLVASSFIKEETRWSTQISTHQILQLNNERIRSLLLSAGFKDVVIHSNYQGREFSPLKDRNMVVRASLSRG